MSKKGFERDYVARTYRCPRCNARDTDNCPRQVCVEPFRVVAAAKAADARQKAKTAAENRLSELLINPQRPPEEVFRA